jgi:hypothetical protein
MSAQHDPHGECALEIKRLQASCAELVTTLQAFVDFLEPMRFDRPSDDARAIELDRLGRALIAKAGGAS